MRAHCQKAPTRTGLPSCSSTAGRAPRFVRVCAGIRRRFTRCSTSAFAPLPAIRRYPGPKLFVVTPHGNTPKDLQNLMPEVPNRVMTGTSHWPHMDKPEEFNRLLDEFLAGIP